MKREELARSLARATHQSSAAAQDQIDELVRAILKDLRQGKPVELPGIGKLSTALSEPLKAREAK
jgi:nucleoid DNA-binding protein